MIHTPSKLIVTAAAAMLLTTGAALADREVKRIDHPNGKSTFAVKPSKRTTTVAVYANGQGVAPEVDGSAKRAEGRTTRIQLGRGQYIPVRNNNR